MLLIRKAGRCRTGWGQNSEVDHVGLWVLFSLGSISLQEASLLLDKHLVLSGSRACPLFTGPSRQVRTTVRHHCPGVSSSSGIDIKRYLVPRNTVYVALVGSKDMDCEWWGAGGGLSTKRKARPLEWHLPRLHLVSVPQTSFLSLSRTCFLPLVSEPFQMSLESLIGTHRRRTLLHWKRVSFPGCRGKRCRMKNF